MSRYVLVVRSDGGLGLKTCADRSPTQSTGANAEERTASRLLSSEGHKPCTVHFAPASDNVGAIGGTKHLNDVRVADVSTHIAQNDSVLLDSDIGANRSLSDHNALITYKQ